KFTGVIQALVDKKLAAGDTKTVAPVEQDNPESRSSNVVDLTELLAKSLARRGPAAQPKADSSPPKRKPAVRPATKKTAAKSTTRKRA
ncbi:MAG: Ku protein, partial [Rubrivivax sp.]|nr:Ku protein [Rubrivivax sp.]